MKVENLCVVDENPTYFKDVKYGFYCKHDIKEDFASEIHDIAAKYHRRAERFMEASKKPTCYFRAVRSADEIRYIENNYDSIDRIIKKNNQNSCIVFLLLEGMSFSDTFDQAKWFCLNIDHYIAKTYQMRYMFSNSPALMDFCKDLMDDKSIEKNKIFDNFSLSTSADMKAGILIHYVEEDREDILNILCQLRKHVNLYIWGAGNYGTIICNYLQAHHIDITGVIDNKRAGEQIKNINILPFEALTANSDVFIAIASSDSIYKIRTQIENTGIKNINVITFSDIYDIYKKNEL